MLRRSTHFAACFSLVSERLASREAAVSGSFDGARRKHTPGKEGDMRRITHISRSLVVAAVFVATAVLAAAFPLVALAGDGGGPTGG
jgi:hypothetical protein